MPAALAVEPSRLVSAGDRLHPLGGSLALAGRDISRALDEVDAHLPGGSAGGAALDLASVSGDAVRWVVGAIDALAVGLAAAAARYVDVDVLSGRP